MLHKIKEINVLLLLKIVGRIIRINFNIVVIIDNIFLLINIVIR